MDGNLVISAKGTQELWRNYPVSVQRWINQHGGLSSEMIYMEGRSLDGIVATCDRPTQRALLLLSEQRLLWGTLNAADIAAVH